MSRWKLIFVVSLLCEQTGAADWHAKTSPGPQRPVALAVLPEGDMVLVANQRAGTVITVNYAQGGIERRWGPFGLLQDLDLLPPRHAVVAVAEPPQLVAIDLDAAESGAWRTRHLSHRPSAICVSGDGARVAVTSRSDRLVTVITTKGLHATDGETATKDATVSLPFQPGRCLWLPDQRHLLVADAYGGKLAVLDAAAETVDSVRAIPAHNIAALALGRGGERVFITHQAIHGGAHTSREDVHWGGILTNVLRSLAVRDLVDPAADALKHNVTVHLGDIGRAAGDPAGVAVRADGLTVVALAGVNELAFDRGLGFEWKRVAVGVCPTAVALTPDGTRAIVANTLDDSLSVVTLSGEGSVERTIPLGPQRTLSPADRGERLFRDARLSHDGWMSCHSCHTDGHTNGQLVDNFTDGTEYTPKRVLSLRGVRDTAPYAWDGHLTSLADQVRHSVQSTMQGEPISDSQVADLVAYLETLSPQPTNASLGDADLTTRGLAIFHEQGCARCHAPPTYTTPETYDVGLKDERGLQRFNPPSLRGVRDGDAFLHDGRASRLEDVFRVHRHELSEPLDDDALRALVAFLRSL